MQVVLGLDSLERFYLKQLEIYDEPERRTPWIIPAESFTPAILAEFGISLSTFKRAFEVYVFDFRKLWKSSRNSQLVLDRKARTVIDGELTFQASRVKMSSLLPEGVGPWVNYITIDGFISNPDLDDLIKNYEPSEPIPWRWPKLHTYLHSKAVQKLFDDLGVTSFDEILPTETDARDFMGKMELYLKSIIEAKNTSQIYNKRTDTYRYLHESTSYVQKKGGQTIYILDRDQDGRPLFSEVPDLIVRELRTKMENRKNPVGKLLIHKDLFKMMVTSDLKGRDLIKACNIDQEINAKCNENDFALYKDRLWREFSISFDRNNHGYPDARTLYIQLHTSFSYKTSNNYEVIDSPAKMKASLKYLSQFSASKMRIPKFKG